MRITICPKMCCLGLFTFGGMSLWSGCDGGHSGIFVGNPPSPSTIAARLAPNRFVSVSSGPLDVDIAALQQGERIVLLDIEGPWALDGGQSIEVPSGTWETLIVSVGDPLEVQISDIDGGSATFFVPLERIYLEGEQPLSIPGRGWRGLVEIGDPLYDPELRLTPEQPLVVTAEQCPATPSCERLRLAFEEGSAAFRDVDGDGEVDDAEREEEEVLRGEREGTGSLRAEHQVEAGCR